MADLTARLTEALDQAEGQARAVKLPDGWYTPDDLTRPHPSGAGLADFDGAHIATWSPERVLALIARDRALLAAHAHVVPVPERAARMVDELRDGWCSRCLPDDTPDATLYAPWPCDPVRLIATFWLPDPKEIR